MKKMNSVLSIRPIVILLCVVFLVFVMCGSAVADKYVYVPERPPGGDIGVGVETSLETALENGTYDVVVLTKDFKLNRSVTINSSNTLYNMVNLISYYPEGLSINANGKTITIPAYNGTTIGTGKQESNRHIVNIYGGSGNYLFNVYGTLNINDKVNIFSNIVDDGVIVVNEVYGLYGVNGELNLDGGNIYDNNVGVSPVNIGPWGHFTMNSGTIHDNQATGMAGGVFIDTHGGFTMNGGNIINNHAPDGGGVLVDNKYRLPGEGFIMSGGNIANNTANNCGGGVYIKNGGLFKQSGGEIRGNTAIIDGGGVYLYANNDRSLVPASYIMSGGKIINNTAGYYGGGVHLVTDFICPEFVQSGGIIKNNVADVGGGVYLSEYNIAYIRDDYNINYQEGAKFTMTGGEIRDNIANTAGGVFVGGAQERMSENRTKFMQTIFKMSGGSIINNTGSPVFVSAGKFVMNGGSITGNNNPAEPTVLVDNTLNIDPTLNVKYKGVFEMGGGSIYYTGVNNTSTGVVNYGDLNISGTAQIYGYKNHGIINYGSFGISGGTIHDNEAKNGGGIYSENSFVMSGGTIASNTASDYGGGIFTNDSFTMTGGKITGNYANYSGAVSFRNNFTMTGGEISNNYALSGGAVQLAGITNTPMTFNFFGGNIHSNTAKDDSGIYFTQGAFNLGNAGQVNANNNVLIGSGQRINVVSDLLEDSGVYSIIPMTNSKQTVAVISVPGKNAGDFIGNFDLYYKNSPYNYYNILETSELNIVTSHKEIPIPKVYDDIIPYTRYATCSVTFEPMNGENATIKLVPFNSPVERITDPVYGSADFLGWFTAYEYEWNFENDTVMSPLTLYAQWEGVPSQKVSPIAVPEPVPEKSAGFKIPTILIAAVAAAIIAAAVVLTVVIIRKRRNSDDDYDDDE